jgi:hypothetical protein
MTSAATVMIVETPIPAIEPWLELKADVPMWHGAFTWFPACPRRWWPAGRRCTSSTSARTTTRSSATPRDSGPGWSHVEVHVVAGGRHYLPDERPDEIADLIERHAADLP